MEKRYQVFVSSTYADLVDERRAVVQTLMEMDCIPAGMELFPAFDEEQFEFIKKVIEDCDYYILIIGGRYGSMTSDGISYTEKEYDYAIKQKLKVVVLLHGNPNELPVAKSDMDPKIRERLEAFRARAMQGRLVKFWTKASDLPGLVSLSLSKTIKTYPAIGWVRGSAVSSAEVLNEVNELRKENAALLMDLDSLRSVRPATTEVLADLGEIFSVNFERESYVQGRRYKSTHEFSWAQIFSDAAPNLVLPTPESDVRNLLSKHLWRRGGHDTERDDDVPRIVPSDMLTIRVQFQALGFISVKPDKYENGYQFLRWTLTPEGERVMIGLRTIKSAKVT